MLAKIIKFLTTDIWRLRLKNYPPSKSFLIRQLRVIILSIRGYAEEISQKLETPVRLVRQILYELVECGVLSEVKTEQDRQVAYQPACDADVLTVKYVMDALESHGNAAIPVLDSSELAKLSECLETFSRQLNDSSANIALKDV